MSNLGYDTMPGTAENYVIEDERTQGGTRTLEMIHHQAADLRTQVRALQEETAHVHEQTRGRRLDELTVQLTSEPLTNLLTDLHERGFAWRDIARVARVSIPALRKWRQGASSTPSHLRRIAHFLGTCQMVEASGRPAEDVAGWFEMPLHDRSSVTPLELYIAGRTDLVLDWAELRDDSEGILDRYAPGWRAQASPFEVVHADDGLPSLVKRQ